MLFDFSKNVFLAIYSVVFRKVCFDCFEQLMCTLVLFDEREAFFGEIDFFSLEKKIDSKV